MTQRELAAQFNVSASALAQWEGGAHAVPGSVMRLVDAYETSVDVEHASVPTGWRRLVESSTAELYMLLYVGLGAPDSEDDIRNRLRGYALKKFVGSARKLRGLTLKLAQMKTYVDHASTPELGATLLQRTAPAMSAASVAKRVFDELGDVPVELFGRFDAAPTAVGSIGQVHQAALRDGRRVAVKVQHPGIKRAIEEDLRKVGLLDSLVPLLFRSQEPGVLSGELRACIAAECDYRHEADRIAAFASIFADRDDMAIPGVHRALSTEHVLTMDWMEGESFEVFAATADQVDRDRCGKAIWDFYYVSALRHGIFNTDPHAGNFLFDPRRVIFLDFGQTQVLGDAFVEVWKTMMRAVMAQDLQAFERALRATGIVRRPELFDFGYTFGAFATFYRPWLTDGRFKFTNEYLSELWSLYGRGRSADYVCFSRDTAFMSQFYFGTASLLARLDARVDCRSTMIDLLYRTETPPEPWSAETIARFSSFARSEAPPQRS
jgi:transcriptional regulator with XRE-family HTH domain